MKKSFWLFLLVNVFICISFLLIGISLSQKEVINNKEVTIKRNYGQTIRDALNTISPIFQKIKQDLCAYENVQYSTPAIGGDIIYKREPIQKCSSGMGNIYYVRCHEWDYENGALWKRPFKDVSMDVFSCIDEFEIYFPGESDLLQNAEMGKKYYRR